MFIRNIFTFYMNRGVAGDEQSQSDERFCLLYFRIISLQK